jgi:gluconate 2-dehydrogenase gamma chain
MSDITRREMLQRLARTIAAAGAIDRLAAQEVHHMVRQAAITTGGRYAAKSLSPHEFLTLDRLTDLIIPAETGKPGAVQADVAAWIDTLLNVNSELKARYSTGLAWLDQTMTERRGADFVTATAAQQTELLDVIAYRHNRAEALNPGIDFFILARRMTADGFYTSPVGMRDVYLGNSPQATFTVPAASLDHVLSRSPLK